MRVYLTTVIEKDYAGHRLDAALAKCFPEHSRARLTDWIRQGDVSVDGKHWEPKTKLKGGESVLIDTVMQPQHEDVEQPIPLDIVYEDDDILILNKPAGRVVHPGAGNRQGTLLNALLYHAPSLRTVPRAGIVHRLDKDTTGLMVVAKTLTAHTKLVADLAARTIEREYLTLIAGEWISGKTIDLPIGRHPTQRTKMAVMKTSGKPARTHFRCHKRYEGYTLLHAKLDTGRTHQIRVHLSHDGQAVVGDSTYGWRYRVPKGASIELQEHIRAFQRQALHAWKLSLMHPVTGERLSFEAPLPEDFATLLTFLVPKVTIS